MQKAPYVLPKYELMQITLSVLPQTQADAYSTFSHVTTVNL